MANWGDIWSGIGLLGQTKKGMYTPQIDAYRNRGKIFSEGLGRISDTVGGISARKWQTEEREAGEDYDANQAVLDRALERDKMWASMFEGAQDRDTMRKEASLDRQLQRDLHAAAEAATNERQKAELEQQAAQWDDKVDQWQQEFDRAGIQWEAEFGLEEEQAKIQNRLLDAQLKDLTPDIEDAWNSATTEVEKRFPNFFAGVDQEGYSFTRSLYELAATDPEALATVQDHFQTFVMQKFPNELLSVMELWSTAVGGASGANKKITPPDLTTGRTNRETAENILNTLSEAKKGYPYGAKKAPGDKYYGTGGVVAPIEPGKVITDAEMNLANAIEKLTRAAQSANRPDVFRDIQIVANELSEYDTWGNLAELSAEIERIAKLLNVNSGLAPAIPYTDEEARNLPIGY